VPAYLLPAKASLYANTSLTSVARLYPALRTIIEGSVVPTDVDLNLKLRTISKAVDKALNDAVKK
jgi:hypothetical protein